MYIWPRLGPLNQQDLLDRVRSTRLDELRALNETLTDDVIWYPTGNRVPESRIADLALLVRDTADQCGWPEGGADARRGFDQTIAGRLHTAMQIVPSDAAHIAVWAHLTLVVVPDVAAWRYGDASDERFTTRTDRNFLGRLWWRAHRLGAGPDDPPTKLGEDQHVAILERTAIGGRVPLARALAEAIASHPDSSQNLMRDAAKLIRRRLAVVEVGALDLHEVTSLVADAINHARAIPPSASATNAPVEK